MRRYGDKPIEDIHIQMLLTGMEHRGNDATGLAMQRRDGRIFILKDDVAAWKFTRSDKYEEFIKENLDDEIIQVILHTRAATKGNPRRYQNNHPLFADKAAIVHNGVLSNDDEQFRVLDLDRKAETDSDIVRAVVDKWGITPEAIQKLNKLRGGAAIAALHPDYPGKMLLGRSGNPLTMGSDENFFVFASEKNVIHRAMRPWVQRWGQWFQKQSLDLAFSPFPDHTLWIIGDQLDEFHDEFKIHYGTYYEPVRRVYSGWKERQRKWDDGASKTQVNGKGAESSATGTTTIIPGPGSEPAPTRVLVACPSCKKTVALVGDQQQKPRFDLFCPKDKGGCGSRLGQYQYKGEAAPLVPAPVN